MSEFRIWQDIEVRFRDTDAMGHVNNAVYLTYLEVARQTYWKRFSRENDYAHVPFVVASVRIDFRSPLHVDEVARVALRTTWVSRSSFAMQYEVRERDSERVAAEAETVQVTFDYEAQRSIPVPDWLRAELERAEGGPLPTRREA
jgi:acyl-CoA thioester hydrolase